MIFFKEGNIGDVKGSLLTDKVRAVGFTKAYFAVALFIDLLDPENMEELEPELLKVLNGELPEFDYARQLYSLHADQNESAIEVDIPVFSEKERHSRLPTITLYHLVSRYNIYVSVMESIKKGETPVEFEAEYDRRMKLVEGYDGDWACANKRRKKSRTPDLNQ